MKTILVAILLCASAALADTTNKVNTIKASGTITAAGAVTAPLHKAADGAGTDTAGTNVKLQGGNSTGTGRAGDIIFQTAPSGASGSTTNTLIDRERIVAKGLTLANNTVTTFCNITCAAGKHVSARFLTSVFVNDSTTGVQVDTKTIQLSVANQSGVGVTATFTTLGAAVQALSGGTLATTFTAVANGNSVDLKVNANSSLTSTTNVIYFKLEIATDDSTMVITPQ